MCGIRSGCFTLLFALFAGAAAAAEDPNVVRPVADLEKRMASMPFEINKAEKARGIAADVALKSDVTFSDGVALRVKLRPANPGGAEFNNEPRYELAAYRLQAAFLDEPDYVVPPTVLRAMPRSQLKPWVPSIAPTFRGSDDVIVVTQYWLKNVAGPKDVWEPARFESDPKYAHHVANLNILTYLIKHGDSNAGNILISTAPGHPRAFAVDCGIAFMSPKADRGELWIKMRVPRVPKATIERLRKIGPEQLEAALGALATWEYRDRSLVPLPGHARMEGATGPRRTRNMVQLGLTKREIFEVDKRRRALLEMVDDGKLGTF